MDEKRMDEVAWDHAMFLGEMASEVCELAGVGVLERARIAAYTNWAAHQFIKHGIKHGLEMAEEGRNRQRMMPKDEGWKQFFNEACVPKGGGYDIDGNC
jgi:hypothetical protein